MLNPSPLQLHDPGVLQKQPLRLGVPLFTQTPSPYQTGKACTFFGVAIMHCVCLFAWVRVWAGKSHQLYPNMLGGVRRAKRSASFVPAWPRQLRGDDGGSVRQGRLGWGEACTCEQCLQIWHLKPQKLLITFWCATMCVSAACCKAPGTDCSKHSQSMPSRCFKFQTEML